MQGVRRRLIAAMGVALMVSACAGSGATSSDDGEDAAAEEASAGDDGDAAADDQGNDAEEDAAADDVAADPDEVEDGDAPDGSSVAAVDLDRGPVEECRELSGFSELDADTITDTLIGTLAEPTGAFRADADLNPLTKAVLLVDANEGALPRARYRLTFGTNVIDTGANPMDVEVVRVDRFNLGPVLRDELVDDLGEDAVGSAEEFGVGPHVSYCLVFRPLQGMTADVLEAARAEIPDGQASDAACLSTGCRATVSVPESATSWEDTGELTLGFAAPYELVRDGAPTPAAALDLALLQAHVATSDGGPVRWTGFEYRESVEPGAPFVDVVIDVGLAQDGGVDLALREGHVMDHTMEAVWQRVIGVASGQPDAPMLFGGTAVEERAAG